MQNWREKERLREQLYRRKATSLTIRSVNSLGDGSKSGRTRRHRMSTMTTQTVYTGACSHERLSKRDRRETVTTLAPFASRIINFGAPTMPSLPPPLLLPSRAILVLRRDFAVDVKAYRVQRAMRILKL